jgi:hypothetical protein
MATVDRVKISEGKNSWRGRGVQRGRKLKLIVQFIGCDGLDCIDLAQEKGRAPLNREIKLRFE